jgi:translation initiation factor IF-3
VRLIGKEGSQIGIVPIDEALDIATRADLDLVEIAGQSTPPVCKIMDFGKYLYEQKKQKAEARKKQHQVQIKEIKFRPGTEENDYQVKLNNIKRFLGEGNKTKVTLRFRGREMAHQKLGMELLNRVEADVEELGAVEQRPKMEGRQMTMVIAPAKAKGK